MRSVIVCIGLDGVCFQAMELRCCWHGYRIEGEQVCSIAHIVWNQSFRVQISLSCKAIGASRQVIKLNNKSLRQKTNDSSSTQMQMSKRHIREQ